MQKSLSTEIWSFNHFVSRVDKIAVKLLPDLIQREKCTLRQFWLTFHNCGLDFNPCSPDASEDLISVRTAWGRDAAGGGNWEVRDTHTWCMNGKCLLSTLNICWISAFVKWIPYADKEYV